MNVVSADALLHPHKRRRLQRMHILTEIMVLIALFSLAGCSNTGGVSAVTTINTEKATLTTTTVVPATTSTEPVTIRAEATSTPMATPTTMPTPRAAATPTAMPTPMATPIAQQPGWNLVWNDEFNGPSGAPPDPSKWTPLTGGGGWGNKQLDYDTNNQNAYQDGQGDLVLEADRSNPANSTCWYGPCQYTSAQISTSGHFSFTYGRIEGRIKIPAGQGLWSA
ncbi:MAG TPA: family 16 glycosylhydrolase, partial [Ktedonobacteraceae bacterium]